MEEKETTAKPILVSVVIPVYNTCEAYLTCCVQSVWNQSYNDLQVILVDDGSRPETAALCDSLASCDHRTVVIHKTNGGVSTARNAGIEAAEGEYLCFVDADDVIHPDFVAILANAMRESGASIAACTPWIGNNNDPTFEPVNQVETCVYSGKDIWKHMNMGYIWDKMYRKSGLNGVRFAPRLALTEDFLFLNEYFTYVDSCARVDAKLYYYRKNSVSATGKMNASKYLDAMQACDTACSFPKVKADPEYHSMIMGFRAEWHVRYMVALASQHEYGWRSLMKAERKTFRTNLKPYRKDITSRLVAVTYHAAVLPGSMFCGFLRLLVLARRIKRAG